jgi:TPR repeat protein
VTLLGKAAREGSPIAQNRLARVLATGIGAPKDVVEALKWHTIAKRGGAGDPELDAMFAPMSAESRAKADAEVKRWFDGQ